jgi:hypothetical protein
MVYSTHGEKRNEYRIFVGNPEGERQVGIYRRKMKNYIKMDLRKIRLGDMDWIHLVQHREQWKTLVNTIMSLRLP